MTRILAAARALAAFLPLAAIAACVEPVEPTAGPGAEPTIVQQRLDRSYERGLTEQPFARGAMAVLSREGEDVRTRRLVPCQGGRAICSGSVDGPAGQLRRTEDYWVVTGLDARVYWLSYGGDGWVERGGRFTPLTWDARANGRGPGDDALLETAYPHPRVQLNYR